MQHNSCFYKINYNIEILKYLVLGDLFTSLIYVLFEYFFIASFICKYFPLIFHYNRKLVMDCPQTYLGFILSSIICESFADNIWIACMSSNILKA